MVKFSEMVMKYFSIKDQIDVKKNSISEKRKSYEQQVEVYQKLRHFNDDSADKIVQAHNEYTKLKDTLVPDEQQFEEVKANIIEYLKLLGDEKKVVFATYGGGNSRDITYEFKILAGQLSVDPIG